MWRFIKKSKFAISLHKSKNSFTLTLDKTLRFLFVGVLIITKTEKTIKTVDKKKKQGKRKIGENHKQLFRQSVARRRLPLRLKKRKRTMRSNLV